MLPKYIEIVFEDKTTGKKIGPMTAAECKEMIGISTSQVCAACDRGHYKNYIITSKANPEFKAKPMTKKKKEVRQMMNDDTTNKSELKLCFDALSIIDNCSKEFGFADIATFIKWMHDNQFVYDALKQ